MNDFNKIMHTIKNNFKESVLFILLIIFLIIIAYFRLKIQLDIGPMYDTYDLLANAALFAGKNIGYSALRPPFLSFLTSIISHLYL